MPTTLASYLHVRWHSHTPFPRLLWRDMWGVGTVVNAVFVFITL